MYLIDGTGVVILRGQLLRALTLDPKRDHYGLGGLWPAHNVLRQVRTMSRDRTSGWGGRIRTLDLLIQSQAPYRLATPQSLAAFSAANLHRGR